MKTWVLALMDDQQISSGTRFSADYEYGILLFDDKCVHINLNPCYNHIPERRLVIPWHRVKEILVS